MCIALNGRSICPRNITALAQSGGGEESSIIHCSAMHVCICFGLFLSLMYIDITYIVHVHVGRALCLEYRVSWV